MTDTDAQAEFDGSPELQATLREALASPTVQRTRRRAEVGQDSTDLVALVADLIPKPSVSAYVADWPQDEQDYYRNHRGSFTACNRELDRMRQEKAARAILAALGMQEGAETVPASWLDEIRDYGDTFRCKSIKAGGVCSGKHISGWGDAMVGISRCEMGHYIVGRIAGLRAGINLPGSDEEEPYGDEYWQRAAHPKDLRWIGKP